MKIMNITILGLMISATLASAGELDGKTYCRSVQSSSMWGGPVETYSHCVSFADNKMNDNANTFFGNPPETINYVLVAGKVLVVRNASLYSDYIVNTDMTVLYNSVGAKLDLNNE